VQDEERDAGISDQRKVTGRQSLNELNQLARLLFIALSGSIPQQIAYSPSIQLHD
jgi:hypothetical protein